MNKFDNLVGLFGAALGMIGIGYALGTHSKMARISEKLDISIEDLANKTPVNIPDSMIERATEKAVALEVKNAVGKATDIVLKEVKRDIHTIYSLARATGMCRSSERLNAPMP